MKRGQSHLNSIKPSYVLLCFLIASCHNPSGSPATNALAPKADLHQYMLPATDLFQGRVFCYVDSFDVYQRFEYIQETISNRDTLLDTIDYDSAYTKVSEEKDRFTNAGIWIVSLNSFKDGKSTLVQLKEKLCPWIEPLQTDDASLGQNFTFRLGQREVAGFVASNFDTVTDDGIHGAYATHDCIQENITVHMGAHENSDAFVNKEEDCLCKGIGKVGSIESEDKRLYLKKIISIKEFDEMRSPR